MDEYRVEMLHLREVAAADVVSKPEGKAVATNQPNQKDEIVDGGQDEMEREEMEDQSSGSNKHQCLNSEEEEEDSWSEPGQIF